jgi:outer membrane receptor protein involved in Fe transport
MKRLLVATPLEAVQAGPNAWRLQPRARASAQIQPRPQPKAPPLRAEGPLPEIVVTASKQGVPYAAYPGSIVKLDLARDVGERGNADASAALVGRAPSLSSTNLGPGRNKLFVRGVADSSFNGPTPATVAQYYGEVRLNYAAPDPNLNLYDVEGVEILEGPQGTLYGSAAIGGIVRLVPNGPVLGQTSGSGEAGALATEKGGIGGDVAAMLNLPAGENAAVRAVGYGVLSPGYIDDAGRGLRDVNRTLSYGARLALRYDPARAVSIEAGGIYQDLESRDGQYAERGLPPLTRSSTIAQPFDNDFRLAYAVTRAQLWGASLVSSTSFVRQELRTQFDATPRLGVPAEFVEDLGLSVLSHETRVTGGRAGGFHWLLGASGLISTTSARRQLGPLNALVQITGVRNREREAALFGEATVPLFPGVSATIGARVNYDEAKGRLLNERVPEKSEPKRSNWRFLPKAALSWAPADHWLVFLHYQEGFRPGGLSVTGPTTAEKFQSDTVWTLEGGFRAGVPERDRLTGSLTVSRTRWQRIQVDLIDASGLPFTSNIGNGYVDSIEAAAEWQATGGLTFEGALFLNRAELNRQSAAADDAIERNFPNIPEIGGRAAMRYRRDLGGDLALTSRAGVRYVGRSFLGVSPPLDLEQGRYALADIEARIGTDAKGVRLSIDNLFDARANRFSYGNPFSVADGRQVTPLRPRTIRIGFDARF